VLVGIGPGFCDEFSAEGRVCTELGSGSEPLARGAGEVYGTAGFKSLMKKKLGVVTAAALSNRTRGILYSDLDVAFLQSPARLFAAADARGGDALFLFDSPLVKDARSCDDFDKAHWEDRSWLKYLSGGLYYVRGSPGGARLVQTAFRNVYDGRTGREGSDQGALQIAAADLSATEDATVGRFPCDVLVNGNVFWGHRASFQVQKTIAVHASWMVGEQLKQKCMQSGGLWLLSDGSRCAGRPIGLRTWIERTANATAQMHPRGGRIVGC